MEINGSAGIAAQEIATNKAQTGFDVLTKTLQKTGQNQEYQQQRLEIAEQTGKGLYLDVKA